MTRERLSPCRASDLDNHAGNGYILSVSTSPSRAAAVLLVNGRIRPEPGQGAPVEALAIAAGRVLMAGSRSRVEGALSTVDRRIDLGGRTVLPAFIESHTHAHRAAVLARHFLDFDALRPASIDDVLAAVAARARTLAPGAWIQGDSLSAARLAEGRLPDRRALDRAGGGRPVVLRGIGKHVVAASSAALAAAGIDATTADPPGGRIERDQDGQPTGILHERAKLRLDQSDPATVVPTPGPAERRAALREATAELHRLGIATLHEMIRLPDEAGDWTALRAEGDGTLPVRVRLFYRVHESPLRLEWLEQLGIRRGLGDDWLRVLGVKISVDGFCIFRNALVHVPYADEPDNCGLLRIEPEVLCDLVARANRQGLQVAIHAVGVRAVDHALDAIAAAGPATAGPYRVEHAYVDVDETRLRRMHDLGVAWSTQPVFRSVYRREWTNVFGPDRRDRLMPLSAGDRLGLPILFNSDTPCAPPDPLAGIRTATDPTLAGRGGAVSRATAWRAFTTVPAAVSGEPAFGRLVPGSPADLVVFDADPLDDANELANLPVRATMIDGQGVFDPSEVFG